MNSSRDKLSIFEGRLGFSHGIKKIIYARPHEKNIEIRDEDDLKNMKPFYVCS